MEFLYPKFEVATHRIFSPVGISSKYPENKSFYETSDLEIPEEGIAVCLVRENIGYKCEWSQIVILDGELKRKYFYVLSENLLNIGNKNSYQPICNDFNNIDPYAPEINPTHREAFIPYVDKKNGLLSVRIQLDYDKILDIGEYEKTLEEVYQEGLSLLLVSRGYMGDNETITGLINKYYTFGFINKDLDLTVKRYCEPLTFTVSIPLNFFNQSQSMPQGSYAAKPVYFINFTNKDFVNNIDAITNVFRRRYADIEKLKYPNKQFDAFSVDIELNNLRSFAVATNELFTIMGIPVRYDDIDLIEYTIGLNSKLEPVTGTATISGNNSVRKVDFNENFMSMARMKGEFNNKRIFNYFLNKDQMIQDSLEMEIQSFINKYVLYPSVSLVEETVEINGLIIPPAAVEQFRLKYNDDSQSCVKLSDVTGVIRSATGFSRATEALFDVFTPNDKNGQLKLVDVFGNLKDDSSRLRDYYKERPDEDPKSVINVNFKNVAFESANIMDEVSGLFKDIYDPNSTKQTTLNTIYYVVGRLRLEEIIFKHLFCYFKKLNPNDPEHAAEMASLPFEIFNYVNYVISLQPLTGIDYIEALERGIYFDPQLTCNTSLAYLLKGLKKLLTTGTQILNQTVKITNTVQQQLAQLAPTPIPVTNPWEAVLRVIIRQTYKFLTDVMFDYLHDILMTNCDDFVDGSGDYADMLNSHGGLDGNIAVSDQDKQKIFENRKNVLEGTYPEVFRDIQYGPDKVYIVNLLDLLFRDIKCLLTTAEIKDLLLGKASKEALIIIKNLIKSRYFKDPNNLSFLLDEERMKLFFMRLGGLVDQKIIEKVEKILLDLRVGGGREWIDVCTVEDYEIRQKFLLSKLPESVANDVLDDANRRNLAAARKFLDRIKTGPKIFKASALCPDFEDEQLEDFKRNLVEGWKQSVRTIFSETLNTFNDESKNIEEVFSDNKLLIRQTSGKKVIDTIDYKNYNYNLSKNMFDGLDEAIGFSYQDTEKNFRIKDQNINYKYVIKDRYPLTDREMSDILLTSNAGSIQEDPCNSGSLETIQDQKFEKFIRDGYIVFDARIKPHNWQEIAQKYSERENIYTEFLQELAIFNPRYFEFLKSKKYVLYVSIDSKTNAFIEFFKNLWEAAETAGKAIVDVLTLGFFHDDLWKDLMTDDDFGVFFRFLYYDSRNGDFKLLEERELFSFEDGDTDQDKDKKNKDRLKVLMSLLTYTNHKVLYDMQYLKLFDPVVEAEYQTLAREAELNRTFPPDRHTIYWNRYLEKYYKDAFFIQVWDENQAMRYRYDRDVPSPWIFNTAYQLGNYFAETKNLTDVEGIPSLDYPQIETRFDVAVSTRPPYPIFTLKLLQSFFNEKVTKAISTIENYERMMAVFEKFDKDGLFNISSIPTENNTIQKKIFVPHDSGFEALATGELEYLEYASFEYKDASLDPKDKEKYVHSMRIPYFLVAALLHEKYFKTVTAPQLLLPEYDFYKDGKKQTDIWSWKGQWWPPYVEYSKDTFEEYFQNEELRVMRNPEYSDPTKQSYEKLTLLNYLKDDRYVVCGLYPHYLNLEYFLNLAFSDIVLGLCDENLPEAPLEMFDKALANLTIRTYVSDLMIKITPLLSLMSLEELSGLYAEQHLVDIFREFIKIDMNLYTADLIRSEEYNPEHQYYPNFVKTIIKKAYNLYKEGEDQPGKVDKLLKKYVLQTSTEENIEIDYFIRKEIQHFLNFTIGKKIITPSKISLKDLLPSVFKALVRNKNANVAFAQTLKDILNVPDKLIEPISAAVTRLNVADALEGNAGKDNLEFLSKLSDSPNLIKNEIFTMIIYFIMASTADSKKKGLYGGTKSELVKVFFRRYPLTSDETEDIYADKNYNQEDIIKFISGLKYAANPALMTQTDFRFKKYVEFFLRATLYETRQILLKASSATDPVIKLTRIINFISATASMIGWSMVDPETKSKTFNDAVLNNYFKALAMERMNAGMSVLPDAIVATGVCLVTWTVPTLLGISYLVTDTAVEGLWLMDADQKIRALREELLARNELDPCKPNDTEVEALKCDEKLKNSLKEETYGFET